MDKKLYQNILCFCHHTRKSQSFLSTFFTGRGDTWTAILEPRANTERTPRLDYDLIFHLHDDDNYDVHTIQQQ